MKISYKFFLMAFIAFTLALSACGGSPTAETPLEDQVKNTPTNSPTNTPTP